MKEFTCIVCPNGCHLRVEEIDGEIKVTGNRCPRGEAFAKKEVSHPMRTICTTVRTVFPETPVVPVRITREIPKEMIFPVMREIAKIRLSERLGTGDVLIENVLGLGSDVMITSDILKENEEMMI